MPWESADAPSNGPERAFARTHPHTHTHPLLLGQLLLLEPLGLLVLPKGAPRSNVGVVCGHLQRPGAHGGMNGGLVWQIHTQRPQEHASGDGFGAVFEDVPPASPWEGYLACITLHCHRASLLFASASNTNDAALSATAGGVEVVVVTTAAGGDDPCVRLTGPAMLVLGGATSDGADPHGAVVCVVCVVR